MNGIQILLGEPDVLAKESVWLSLGGLSQGFGPECGEQEAGGDGGALFHGIGLRGRDSRAEPR